MTVSLTGANGLFDSGAWGGLAAMLEDFDALRGGTASARVLAGASLKTRANNLVTNLGVGSPAVAELRNVLNDLENLKTQIANFETQKIIDAARKILIRRVQDDNPQAAKTEAAALKELFRQMTASSASVQASTVTAGAQANIDSPTGNPAIVVSVKDPAGNTLEYALAEDIVFECVQDSYANYNTIPANEELWQISGEAAVDRFSQDWPKGSGGAISQYAVDYTNSYSGSQPNVFYNGGFSTFTTANYPDNWVIAVGAAGTNFFDGAGSGYLGSGALEIRGDGGGTASQIYQPFYTSPSTTAGAGGSPFAPKGKSDIAFAIPMKRSAGLVAGVIALELVNAAGAVIADDAGTNNTTSVAFGDLTTSYAVQKFVYRIPSVLPTGVRFQFRITTAFTNAQSMFMQAGATPPLAIYPGGPRVAVFAGSTRSKKTDKLLVNITVTHGKFQKFLKRVFGVEVLDLRAPTSGSPTVSDTLVT